MTTMTSSPAPRLGAAAAVTAVAGGKIRRLEGLCVARLAQCIQDNSFTFKSLRGLPRGLLQQIFDGVTSLWTQKWNKTQVLRVLLLFTEPNLTALHLEKTLAHDYLLEAMMEKAAATFPPYWGAGGPADLQDVAMLGISISNSNGNNNNSHCPPTALVLPAPSTVPNPAVTSSSTTAAAAAAAAATATVAVAVGPTVVSNPNAVAAGTGGAALVVTQPAVFVSLRSLSLCISTQTTSRKVLVAFLAACPNLRFLRLAIPDDAVLQRLFADVDLVSLLPRLETLEINYQGNSKTHVKRRTSQNNLVLPNTFILDLINQPMNQLNFLSLRDRLLINPTTIKTLILRAPSLSHLILDNTEVTDSNISSLARHCRQLKTLSLRECRRLTDAAFEEIGRGFLASLQHLSIAGCRKLTDTTLNYLIEGSPKLKVLDARGCTANFVHETSLLDVLTGLRHLDVMVISFNDSKSLDDITPESGKKVQVSRRFFHPEQQATTFEYYFFHNPTVSSPLPHLPRPCHQIWPPAFWTTSL